MNNVVLIGRLTRDPELKFTPSSGTAVSTVTIAVNRRLPSKDRQHEADFIPVVIWGKQAENTANFLSKGRLVGVKGRIQVRSYETKDGSNRYVTEVVAEEVQFLDRGKGDVMGNNELTSQSNGYYGFDNDMTPVEDGDIPF